MREKINKLARGVIDDSTPLVSVEPNSIEYDLTPGDAVRFSVHLSSKNNVYIKGLAYSSDSRIKVANPSYGGLSVNLAIDAMMPSSDDAEEIYGSIDLVTNGGEIELPFLFHKLHKNETDIISPIVSLNDFAEIVAQDKNTAFALFENRSFQNAPFLNNLKTRVLYNTLKKNPDRKIAFKQFLIGTGIAVSKKSDYLPDKTIENLTHERAAYFRRLYYEYARLRFSYEMDRGNPDDEISAMSDYLGKLSSYSKSNELITLLKAELNYLKKDYDTAGKLMESVRETIIQDRQEYINEYFLLEYLDVVALGKENKKASFIRLCKKFIEEEKMHRLFYYVLKLDDELVMDDNKLHNFLNDVYSAGSRSPYLYYNVCLLLNDHPEYLYAPKAVDNQALNFGTKYKMLDENIHSAVVSASCISFIKADRKSVACHKFFAEGVNLDLSINGLYEYYLYSMPSDNNYRISDKVFQHYINGDTLDINNKIKLYSNLVRFKNKNTNIYKGYEDRITDFAINQLEHNNINPYLAEIYNAVIKPDMLSADNAESMFVISNSYLVKSDAKKYRTVVIVYPLTAREFTYRLHNGSTVVPIFDTDSVMLLEAHDGNRFVDAEHSSELLISNNTLRNAAIKAGASDNLIKLIRVKELINKKNINIEDVQILEDAVYNPEVNDDAKTLIIKKLINYYNQHTASGYNPSFLHKINKNNLKPDERQQLINAYITCGCYKEAFEMISAFGYEDISNKNLHKLCSNLILENLFNQDQLLLNLAMYTVEQNVYDVITLDYLCEHYNGPTDKMFNVLKKAISSQSNTYDMEERLLAQQIFINDKNHIDQVFDWYVSRKKANDSIVKAYFTIKSADYFFDDLGISSKIIEYLEKSVADVEDLKNIPIIYMLALTRYYSRLSKLSKLQTELSERFVNYLCRKKLIFPYFKRFADKFELPLNIINAKIVVYKSSPCTEIVFKSQITPTEKSMVTTEPINIYMNLHIYAKDLFNGEQWKYEIYEIGSESLNLVNSGVINADDENSSGNNLMFDSINEICKLNNSGKDADAASKMEDYIIVKESVKTLFNN